MSTTSSIGSASRNYSTVAAWHAAFANGGWIGEMYADSEFVTTAGVTIGGTSGTNYEILRAASGQSVFDNTANKVTYDPTKGVSWKQTNQYVNMLTLSSYVTIQGLSLHQIGGSNGDRAIEAAGFTTTFGVVIDRCLILSECNDNAYASAGLRVGGQGDVLITNTVIIQNKDTGVPIKLVYANNVVIVNCTIVLPPNVAGSQTAFADFSNATLHIYNTAIFGFGSWTAAGSNFVGSNNATDNASIPGTMSANLTSQTYSSCFNNNSTSTITDADFALSGTSPLIDAGADKHATYAQVANDLFGTARPVGSAYDIGAVEYATPPPPNTLILGPGHCLVTPQAANFISSLVTTRLYLQNQSAGYSPTTFRGAWDATGSAVTKKLGATKSGTSTTVALAETSTTNNFDVLLARFVSDPFTNNVSFLANAVSTIAWIMMVTESNASANDFFHIHAYVTTGDSDTPRGTVLTDNIGGTEWTTTGTGRGEGAKTNSAVSAQIGDRLVIEVGYQAQNTSATSFTGTLRYGGTGADVTQGSTTTSQVGWVEFITNGDPFGTPAFISGTASITLGAVTSSATGVLPIQGSSAKTLENVTCSAAGGLVAQGTANISLGNVTSSGSAVTPIQGSASITLGDVALAATGTTQPVTVGQAVISLGDVTCVGAANLPINGTAAITLGAVTLSAASTLGEVGTANITIGNVTCVGTGKLVGSGAANITLGNVISTATAILPIQALTNGVLGNVTLVATASTSRTGTANIQIGDVTCVGTTDNSIHGVANVTLGNVTCAGSATLLNNGNFNCMLDDVTCVASGVLGRQGTASITLGDVTIAATGTTPNKGTAAIQLGNVTLNGAAVMPIKANAAIQIGNVTCNAQLQQVIKAVLSVTLGDFTLHGTAHYGNSVFGTTPRYIYIAPPRNDNFTAEERDRSYTAPARKRSNV